jgi:hypothetical protein
LALLTQAIR